MTAADVPLRSSLSASASIYLTEIPTDVGVFASGRRPIGCWPLLTAMIGKQWWV